jgi:hypothetical protein
MTALRAHAIGTSVAPRRVASWVYALAAVLMAVGAVTFGIAVTRPDPAPAWRALLVSFLYWASLGGGALIWSVIQRVARTAWSAPVNRLGHATLGLVAFVTVMLGALYFGRQYYLTWLRGGAPPAGGVGDRGVWLNVPSVYARDLGSMVVLLILAAAYVGTYRASDRAAAPVETAPEARRRKADRRLSSLGVILCAWFAITFTLIAFDQIMSLAPAWFSALFGAYFFAGALYEGIAALIIMALLLRRWLGIGGMIGTQQLQDLGNLMLAFAMIMTYFFFSQALVIWYGNLPLETSFVLPRIHYQPWQMLCWIIVWTAYLGTFSLLVIREMKENPRTLFAVAAFVLASMWLERYLLVIPSLQAKPGISPVLALLISLGFGGVFVATAAAFLARCPAVSELDRRLIVEREAWR